MRPTPTELVWHGPVVRNKPYRSRHAIAFLPLLLTQPLDLGGVTPHSIVLPWTQLFWHLADRSNLRSHLSFLRLSVQARVHEYTAQPRSERQNGHHASLAAYIRRRMWLCAIQLDEYNRTLEALYCPGAAGSTSTEAGLDGMGSSGRRIW
jgi:hypothetical protein